MQLLTFPNDELLLRRRANDLPPEAFNTDALRLLAEEFSTLLESIENVDVLAATQVDVDPCWRILILRGPKGHSVMLNPRIRSHSGESFELGACASFACVPQRMLCPVKLVVEFRRLDGMMREQECGPSGARAVWQGIDSLNGKLFSDRLDVVAKAKFFQKIRHQRMQGRA